MQSHILNFSQSEKIKAGLIWVSQALDLATNLPEDEKRGAVRCLGAIVTMLGHDVHLAWNLSGDAGWGEVDGAIGKALLMFDSGVGSEAVHELTRALSQVTSIGQRAMMALKAAQLF